MIIEVHAAGVGFPDLLMTKGQYQFKPTRRSSPGVEAAGVVLSAPAGRRRPAGRPRDRVVDARRVGGGRRWRIR